MELLAFAEAVVGGGEDELAVARRGVLAALGADALVDASAVAANFERMVRVADATGIALDADVDWMTASYRAELGVEAYGSAANTPPPSWLRKLVGRAVALAAPRAMRWMARRRRRRVSARAAAALEALRAERRRDRESRA